ncbi:MAG: ATP-binding protein [Cellulophaga sp.]|uniref:PAS domain-containing sensor histidine kinase n=1 Tax=unclassified Cellulophaga TaxID=2634405 RepID=UPI000C2C00DE|nr:MULTISPECIES: ATP-binding protein [unclassified Cellulophaga]MDO6490737.1 ATP-binding protein [Cellulophaga sp. 2_MG-2023]MDO6494069.1 ATP-binding protein [Cellulophaga sp. 3_MG-2023]PKB43917.1 PAS domain-containing protein [Cellulophaga sp. RHA19]
MSVEVINVDSEIKGAFFDMAHTPSVIFDKNMVFLDMNEAAISTLNIKKDDFIGKSILEAFPYLEGTERLESYKKVIETGVPISLDEISFYTDDKTFVFIVRAFKVGEGLGVTTLDVTNLIATIDKLKATQNNLEKVNKNLKQKNKELEEFSYVAAHDLRAPLTNMQSLFGMLESSNVITDEVKPIFDKLKYVGKLMCDKLKALNNVIALKSSLEDKKEVVNFKEVVAKIKAIHSEKIINTRAIIKEDFAAYPKINYNAVQFESILHNLISNAIKYKHPRRKPIISVTTQLEDNKPVLIVKDNGLGFDTSNDSTKVFGLFKRMHTHVEGLGVGLYILHSIVVNNGGKVLVESEENKGTQFKIYF